MFVVESDSSSARGVHSTHSTTVVFTARPTMCAHPNKKGKKKETYPKALPFGAFERWRIYRTQQISYVIQYGD
jgi:hypothetical protein